jgi:hypothetical protein
MNEDKIVEVLEGHDIPGDKIAQIVDQLKEQSREKPVEKIIANDLAELEIKNEKDPYKKAALVAGKISNTFDE